jgi:hypothetical protein
MANLKVINGCIKDLIVRSEDGNFVFSDRDRNVIGGAAVVAAIAGMAGPAMSTAISMADTAEPAHFVQFIIEGETVAGWLWFNPFKEGDDVEAVVSQQNEALYLYAIARPRDRIIALHPHCSRGRSAHWKNAARWFFKGGWWFGSACAIFFAIVFAFDSNMDEYIKDMAFFIPISYFSSFAFAFFATPILAKKWMPFVNLAEEIFIALKWESPEKTDLVKSSKTKKSDDAPCKSNAYGHMFFRY